MSNVSSSQWMNKKFNKLQLKYKWIQKPISIKLNILKYKRTNKASIHQWWFTYLINEQTHKLHCKNFIKQNSTTILRLMKKFFMIKSEWI